MCIGQGLARSSLHIFWICWIHPDELESLKHVGHFSVELGKYSVIKPPFTVVIHCFVGM